ncbi:glutamate-ammonia-ligase adenylyltransferase [Tateyamaria omphalii]|uniref:[protein-PII] uridylyltransferase family protein n=1 Tax=Tateyamaria omphalii TaxID=299262 RepID=UPI00167344AE|nr:glutamine-synthetase adenylyltransferase [Tateyamaria omphalii]GGX46745.1 glutamate-ammonia-ligase adenylyltransferase [Tateyamaria omphalii]
MRLEDHITRMPRPFDPERGQAAASAVPAFGGALRDLIVGTAGCSPYLAGLIEKEGTWLPAALDDLDAALEQVLMPPSQDVSSLKPALRQAKRRVALLAALADLSGAWCLEEVTGALTRLADMACDVALSSAIAEQVRRGRLPDSDVGLFVLAMGKMGAFELNYSSDIDLICLFDETRHAPSDYASIRKSCVRAVQEMCKLLSDLTEDGYVFRTDLRLRPDPSVTPVVLSTGAAERYYESLGRTWERAAYIKARPCAGDLLAGQAFLDELRPFVWRRHLDFAAVQDAHDMRLAIRTHKGTGGPITLPGHDMKLGRGGIREIEFFTQTRQLIAGGRDPDLQVRDTVSGLSCLAIKGWVPDATASTLTDHYRFARMIEHRIQMQRDAQTHKLPASDEGFERLAAMVGTDRATLEAELKDRLSSVHTETEGFFAPDVRTPKTSIALDDAMQARWRSYPALRSARGAALFDRIEPVLLERLSSATKPDEALAAFDGFLAGLPAGVQLFSLFEANPQLVDLLVDIVGTSPALAQYLSRNAGVLDAVIGGSFFDAWPGCAALTDIAIARLNEVPDYESKLDAIRAWAKEWHFRIGVHHLRQLTTATEAGKQYSDLARASIGALWPEVQAHFAKRHGTPPGRGGVILGMGSLGAGHLTPQSDLDLIVVYDPDDVDQSVGPRPLQTRIYYARLTQAMITAVTAQTAQGRLYEADMRLRPSGNQGPVATSWSAFQRYQREDAWLWEHLALVRATVVAGPADVAQDVEQFRRSIIGQNRDQAAVLTELSEMRSRIADAKQPASVWDAKIGAGRLQDIELFAQAGAVLTGEVKSGVRDGLNACVAAGIVSDADAQHLAQTHGLLWRVQIASRLLSTDAVDLDAVGAGGQEVLLRAVELGTRQEAENRLAAITERAAEIIDAATRGEDIS